MATFNRYNSLPETLPDKEFALVKVGDGYKPYIGGPDNTPVPLSREVDPATENNHPVRFDQMQEAIGAGEKTGTLLDLSKVSGNNYYYAGASAALSYTTENPVVNGYAHCLINASSEPVVYETDGETPATKIPGADFAANSNMELVVESKDGVNIRYFFLPL